ncbi:MotA/TolQ/ExbB proton channel family protein [Pseudobacteriovorax antillogorgiicola]|uniref:Outer membrane transport energization protein ExbB n=1 Tax=Pseudobacteriovorax antillogorgiicola TaxID=1513793 RepID=A0A1Y6BTH3_9BACT|nr:MotA/TolQ/ExbB proton channel family protein [Pseudobacteriovorax antillogorgiicola]TCS53922.1 outer membrane transport energization protein ExbB [Pseudobacteriovorax antillogorgiicola]SMF20558.1 outer membrane transport energization protein ExbB [Pseudobacteriovorax antillogorgiicola]
MTFFKSKVVPFAAVLGLALSSASLTANAQANSLDQLLEQVKRDKAKDNKINKEREAKFLANKNEQQAILNKAKAELAAQKARGETLKTQFDSNEKQLSELETKLKMTMGTLGELFGVVRQVAGDAKGSFETSLVTAENPGRTAFVDDLSRRKSLPDSSDLAQLWVELLTEMTESGKVSTFKGQVTLVDGTKAEQEVTRIGVFNLVSQGKYLRYDDTVDEMIELGRQPASRFLSQIKDFESAGPGELSALGIDPSRGSILSALVQAPSLWERFQQGGIVGWVIASVLFVGLILTGERMFYLTKVGRQIKDQLSSRSFDKSNPLGLIFATYEENKDKDIESLELKLDEAIIKGTSSVEKGLGTIKILASVAPLLGLLGTVTGMIGTFQSMMLFGTGDPKVMAGGISQALVTTVLGLVAAIPLILLHSFVSGRSKAVLSVLEEQSAGLMASRVEEEGKA